MAGTAILQGLNKNIPRYFLAHFHGEEALGIFCVLVTPLMAGTILTRALNQATCPRLSRQFVSNRLDAFRRLFRLRMGLCLLLGLFGIVVVVLAAEPVMQRFARPDYARHWDLLIYFMIAATMTYFSGGLETALVAVRRIRPLVPLMSLAVLTSVGTCWFLVPRFALHGAAVALAVSKVPYLLVGLLILSRIVDRQAEANHNKREAGAARPLVSDEKAPLCAE